jgi:3-phosphoshikimate 1-carboxyvinyltransferase
VIAPPSKSAAHRLLICAALSGGVSTVRGIAPSQDMLATMDCLRALGARIDCDDEMAVVTGAHLPGTLSGAVLPCRESGSSLRFLIPLALLHDRHFTFTGSRRLFARPLSVYEGLCRAQGLLWQLGSDSLTVCGPLTTGTFTIPGDISSQFISGLLFVLPLLDSDSVIRLLPPVESRPYIDMTLQALSLFGVTAGFEDEVTIRIPGSQQYMPRDVAVEGDWSNAAFFDALNTLGGDVQLSGLQADSLQGDRVYPRYFAALRDGSPTLDLSDCPDLGPVCMALAAALHGAVFTGTQRLQLKESDRVAAMAEELAKFGVRACLGADTVTIPPSSLQVPTQPLLGHNDHRIVMALAVLSTRTGGVIRGAEAVAKSLPDFFPRLQHLGIEVETYGMDQ